MDDNRVDGHKGASQEMVGPSPTRCTTLVAHLFWRWPWIDPGGAGHSLYATPLSGKRQGKARQGKAQLNSTSKLRSERWISRSSPTWKLTMVCDMVMTNLTGALTVPWSLPQFWLRPEVILKDSDIIPKSATSPMSGQGIPKVDAQWRSIPTWKCFIRVGTGRDLWDAPLNLVGPC